MTPLSLPCVEIGADGEARALQPTAISTLDITFFVPCYNEEKNVRGALEKLKAAAESRGLKHEILVFDDCSSDRTADVIMEYRRANPSAPVRLFRNERNMGISRNFFEGAFQGRGRYYRLICGDDIEPIETHLAVLARMGEADMVIPFFTRIEGRPFHRHVISSLYTKIVNLVSGQNVRYYNGCPLYRRADVVRFHIEATGWGYQAEFLTRLLHEGRSYVEVPLVSIDREGSGALNARNAISVAHSLLKIALRRLRVRLFK
jgi:glycosyltransferase involved in cell wall biosynthesis